MFVGVRYFNDAMIERFIRYIESERRYSPLTVRNYRRDIERFVAWWEDRYGQPFDPAQVKAEQVSDWMDWRGNAGNLQAGSLNRELSSVRSFFRFLRREGLIDHDVLRLIHSVRTPKHLPTFIPKGRMQQVISGCVEQFEDSISQREQPLDAEPQAAFLEQRDALIVLLLYGCGLRLAELVGVNRDDFLNDYTLLRVRGKGNKERMVPLPDFVREKIISYLDAFSRQQICKKAEKALFLSCRGSRISRTAVYRLVHKVLEDAGVQGQRSPHVLRHTFATHLLRGGADMRAIQELMGHASLRSTQVYTHNSISHLRAIYAQAHPRQRRVAGEKETEAGDETS